MKMKIRNKAAFTDEVTPLEEENARVSYEAALEGIVLLENDGTLPIVPGKVALYGAGAGMTIKGGTGSGEVNERHAVSILEGMEAAGFTVTTKNWLTRYEEEYRRGEEEYAAEFRRRMLKLDVVNMMGTPYQYPFGDPVTIEDVNESDTDTCIYVIARQAGESADRKLKNFEYSLSDEEKANLAMCAANYEKMIVVINVGSVFDMSFLDEIAGIGAVVYYAQQGMKGGNAFADLICGKVSPSAKTVDTWPEKYEDIPFAMDYSYLNGDVDQEYYREGIYVGYRYFDSYDVEPRYPFGYGLSYTDFAIETGTVTAAGGKVTVSAKVTNTGSTYSGREVVQLYVSCPKSGMAKEYQKLAAFAKTEELKPGESTNVSLTFAMEELASYREEDAAYVLEKGDYILRAGASSRDTSAAAVLVLDEDIVTEQCENICPTVLEVKEMEPPMLSDTADEQDTDLERIPVKAADIATAGHLYEEPEIYSSPVTDAVLNVLTEEELCDVVTGAGAGGNGAKFFDAPGSAGYTTGELLDKGLPNVCLADGPAGLRLQKTSAVTRSGQLKGVEPMLSAMNYVPGVVKRIMLGNPAKQPCVYQFATSFPTGLALAQSWNTALAERVGKAVGKEMERYGVTYWLAPGMNIHRNPLGGRNFEYYSEDPFLSGKCAAAVTRGVQETEGLCTVVKHFACNDAEDNRNHSSSNVSERALREIHLRGFEYAVKEAQPHGLMSSYNRINHVYAPNSHDLLTDILRCEWGYQGLVMTDWGSCNASAADAVKCAPAGNDIVMPGAAEEAEAIRKAMHEGLISQECIRRSAARVLRVMLKAKTEVIL